MQKELFSNYILEVRGLSLSSSNHYLDSLKKISSFMITLGYDYDSIYGIDSYEELLQLKNSLINDDAFKRLNLKGHQMYSAGLNRYIEFSEGNSLNNKNNLLSLLDEPCPVKPAIFKSEIESERRDRIIVNQVLIASNYECEINKTHKSFISKNTHQEFMEAHHLIPLNMQKEVSNSLDVYSNLICLCPNCHKLLHFGMKEDKQTVIDDLFDYRKERLQDAGLNFGKREFDELLEESRVYY
jgi:5-methylcytosine-specific restriction protein A